MPQEFRRKSPALGVRRISASHEVLRAAQSRPARGARPRRRLLAPLAEEFAALDARVTGVEYCCDVLEDIGDVDTTVREIARMLRPGGVFLYDTINRPLRSRLLVINLSQEWRGTRWAELEHVRLEAVHLSAGTSGSGWRGGARPDLGVASLKPLAAVRPIRDGVRGAITYGEMGRRIYSRQPEGAAPHQSSSREPDPRPCLRACCQLVFVRNHFQRPPLVRTWTAWSARRPP
jgi:SAM-dependent methyltransferase